MEKNLPIFQALLDDYDSIDFISLVESPAIEKDFLYFSKEENKQSLQLSIEDEEERVILSPVAIPDKLIYRRDGDYEYYVTFSADTIKKMQLNFFKAHRQNSIDFDHTEQWVDGMTIFSSFITDEKLGIQAPKGYEDCPQGTWFIQMKVDNELIWKNVKSGEFNGVSLSGMFYHAPVIKEEVLEDKLKDMYFSMFK